MATTVAAPGRVAVRMTVNGVDYAAEVEPRLLLVSFLRERNLERNTIFIYMTDNGSASGAQVFNAGMRGSKGSAYEGGHRVPFFFHWPEGGYSAPRDIDRLSAHIDVLPTMLDLCGLKRPAGPAMHGKSLRPLLEGKAGAWQDRAITVDSQRLDTIVKWRQAAVMTQRWRLSGWPGSAEIWAWSSEARGPGAWRIMRSQKAKPARSRALPRAAFSPAPFTPARCSSTIGWSLPPARSRSRYRRTPSACRPGSLLPTSSIKAAVDAMHVAY